MDELELEMQALGGVEEQMDERILANLEAPISGVPTPETVVPQNNADHPRSPEGEGMEAGMELDEEFNADELTEAYGM